VKEMEGPEKSVAAMTVFHSHATSPPRPFVVASGTSGWVWVVECEGWAATSEFKKFKHKVPVSPGRWRDTPHPGFFHLIACWEAGEEGTRIAVTSEDTTIDVFGAETGDLCLQIVEPHAEPVSCLKAYDRGGWYLLITGSLDGRIFVHDAETGTRLHLLPGTSLPIAYMELMTTEHGRCYLASGGQEGRRTEILVWDLGSAPVESSVRAANKLG
jgi:WD40 repeat protein